MLLIFLRIRMLNKLQIYSSIENYFQMVLVDSDAYSAVNATQDANDAYKKRLQELLIRMNQNSYVHSSFAKNGKLVSNIDFQETPMVTAIEDLIPNAQLPFPSVALEFEIKYEELLKPSQQNGFHLSQVVILADEVNCPKHGQLIRIAPLYQVHNFTTGQKHYTISEKDIFINTNIDVLKDEPNSVILIQNQNKEFTQLNAFDYQNLSAEMSSASSILQWLIALSCENVELVKGTPPTQSENDKRKKKNKPLLYQYHEAFLVNSNKRKPNERIKFGEIYFVAKDKIWKNI